MTDIRTGHTVFKQIENHGLSQLEFILTRVQMVIDAQEDADVAKPFAALEIVQFKVGRGVVRENRRLVVRIVLSQLLGIRQKALRATLLNAFALEINHGRYRYIK